MSAKTSQHIGRLRVSVWRVTVLASSALMFAPSFAAACSVCMTGKEDDTRIAFELMTAFMTVIPFVLAGGVFYWLRGRVRELEANHERAREASELAAPGTAPAARGASSPLTDR